MLPLTSPPSYPGLNAPRRLDRAIGTLMTAAAALVIGASIGGASVFALVSALTVSPKGSERSTPAAPAVAAAPVVNPSSTESATTTTAIPAQTNNSAAQLQQSTPRGPATTPTQAQVTSPIQDVKPWPDALSRASHPTAATTATNAPTGVAASRAPNQSAPAQAAAPTVETRPEADTAKRTAGRGADSKPSRAEAPRQSPRDPVRSKQRTIATSEDPRSAADEETAADGRRPIWDFVGDRHLRDDVTDREKGVPPNVTRARSFGSSRPTIVQPRDRNYADERQGQWADQQGGGFFDLFGRRDNRWVDRENWRENNRFDD
jgi:hypothetical protein